MKLLWKTRWRRCGTAVTAAALLALAPAAGAAAATRSHAVTAAFQRLSPCPATGLPTGRCPGWVKDHIVPLCAGGADAVANLQWQTVAAAKAKDRAERARCRRTR